MGALFWSATVELKFLYSSDKTFECGTGSITECLSDFIFLFTGLNMSMVG